MSKFKNYKCLIVDDYSTARNIIKKSLNELGFTCFEAENCDQAMAIILQKTLHLVITDLNLPKKSGLALLEEIKNDDVLNNIPVVLTMIDFDDASISAGQSLGMSDYLIKPFDVFTLSKVLDKVIIIEGGEAL